jgi:hypothetical protein
MQQTAAEAPATGRPVWLAEVFVEDGTGADPVATREIPGVPSRGLAVAFVHREMPRRLEALSGSVERVGDRLLLVGDGRAEPRAIVVRGRVRLGHYGEHGWSPDEATPAATATLGPDGTTVVWGAWA